MAKKKLSRQKKQQTRVDFTPMVDMMMLLITFFMLCTSLSKPSSMNLTMPSNDKNIKESDKNETKETQTVTVYLAGNNKIYYVHGFVKYDDPTCLVETSYGANGIRKALIGIETGEGKKPVAITMLAKNKLDKERMDKNLPDSVYQKKLDEIKAGNLGEYADKDSNKKIGGLTVIIKALDPAVYDNLVDVLDEMDICCIGTYVIDTMKEDDIKLMKLKGIETELKK